MTQIFSVRVITVFVTKLFDQIWLQMDGKKIRSDRDALFGKTFGDFHPVNFFGQTNDENKPAWAGCGRCTIRYFNTGDFFQPLKVPIRNLLPFWQKGGEPLHLRSTQGGAHFIQPVVISQVGMLQPGISGCASLVAQGAHETGRFIIIGNNQSTFPGSNLFVGIEGKNAIITQGTGRAAFIFCPKCLAGIFDNRDIEFIRDFSNRVVVSRLAEDIYR